MQGEFFFLHRSVGAGEKTLLCYSYAGEIYYCEGDETLKYLNFLVMIRDRLKIFALKFARFKRIIRSK